MWGLLLVLVEGVCAVAGWDGGGGAAGDEGEPDVFGERLGVRDALGVGGVEREGDGDGLGGGAAPVVAGLAGLEGGQLADVDDAGVLDNDLGLVGALLVLGL